MTNDDWQAAMAKLEAENELLRKALEPFALAAQDIELDRPHLDDNCPIYGLTVGDFRRANLAFKTTHSPDR